MGPKVGCKLVGRNVGDGVGILLGEVVGIVGRNVGDGVGILVGKVVGNLEGRNVGIRLTGDSVGLDNVSLSEGLLVGRGVGATLGVAV